MSEQTTDRALLIGIDYDDGQAELSLDELERLCETAGIETIGKMLQRREKPDIATFIGAGKVAEAADYCKNNDINIVIADEELKGSQVRELEDALDLRVIDRTTLILDIFAMRAESIEGKLQVELAQYKYRLPRLLGYGNALSRLGGGIGTRGPGETKLETDRRHIHRRIAHIEKELEQVAQRRAMLRGRRQKNGTPTVALIGYTNAGKSSLMNALCENADVYAQDQLFATLDPTIRKLITDQKQDILLIDTVGFIRKLPHTLVQAFRSTLEESVEASLLLHVIDASDPDAPAQIDIVDDLMRELGAGDKPIFRVFNKCDLSQAQSAQQCGLYLQKKMQNEHTYQVSAFTGAGLDELKDAIIKQVVCTKECVLRIPYADGNIVDVLHRNCEILSEDYRDDGIYIKTRLTPEYINKYESYIQE